MRKVNEKINRWHKINENHSKDITYPIHVKFPFKKEMKTKQKKKTFFWMDTLTVKNMLLGFVILSLIAHALGLKPYQKFATRGSRKFKPHISPTIRCPQASQDPSWPQSSLSITCWHLLSRFFFILCKDLFPSSAALQLQESDSLLFLLVSTWYQMYRFS